MNTLDHLRASETRAVERYLLGELSGTEAEDFELHYFECPECALAVESGGQFISNARAVFVRQSEEAGQVAIPDKPNAGRNSFRDLLASWVSPAWVNPAWMRPAFIPVSAAILFGATALYQGAVLIPGLRQTLDAARALPAFQLAGASRGEGDQVTVPAGSPFFALSLDIPPDTHFGQYVCDLSAGGRSYFRVTSPAPAPGQPVTILVPVRGLKKGSYELTVSGSGTDGRKADKIAASTFHLQFTQ